MAKVNWLAERRSFASTDELNKFLERAMAVEELLRPEELTPEQKAQTLVYDAWEAKSSKERIELALRARLLPSSAGSQPKRARHGRRDDRALRPGGLAVCRGESGHETERIVASRDRGHAGTVAG